MEDWKDIQCTDGRYQVSDSGKVRSVDGHDCWLEETQRGYLRVSFQINKRRIRRRVHRLVAENFIPNPHNLPQVDHINGDRKDNRVCNLRWVSNMTNSANTRHRCSRKPVAIILQDGTIDRTFTSEKAASRYLGVNRTGVSAVCNGFQKTVAGVKVIHV